MIFRFNDYKLDDQNYQLTLNDKIVTVEPKTFDLICLLIQNHHRLISRQEIFDKLWLDREVSDTALSNHIKSARKILGDNGKKQKVIKTIHGRGYQFVAQVEVVEDNQSFVNSVADANQTLTMGETISTLVTPAAVTLQEPSSEKNTQSKILPVGIIAVLVMIVINWISPFDAPKNKPTLYKIAVLPFSNIKPDKETNYFGFAIADQIIGELAYLKKIAVRPSSAIRQYIKPQESFLAIGEALNVNYILNGSYLKIGNNIRLSIELVEVETGQLLWREKDILVSYENAFELQDMVAKKVVDGLQIQFSETEFKRIRKDISASPLAYEYYIRSISYPYTTDGNQLAAEMLKKSISLDEYYAPTYVQLADRLRRLEQFGLIDTGANKSTEEYYLHALSLNQDLMSALSYLSMFYTEINRIDEAMQLARRMVEINPNSANTHFTLGYIYRYAGLIEQATQEMQQAVSIDPKNPRYRSLIGTYSSSHQYQKALDMLNLYSDSAFSLGWKGLIAFQMKKYSRAIDYFEQVRQIDPVGLWGHVATIYLAFLNGKVELGLLAIAELERTKISDGETIYYIANYYGLLGDKKSCIGALKRAVEAGYFNFDFIKNNSYFDFLQNDPEFQAVLLLSKQKHLAFVERFF